MGERASRRLDAEALFEYALGVLSARAHSIAELREKLLRRAERTQDVPSVLTRLKQCGYLDDRSFATSFSVSRLENQGLGGRRVLSDLRKRRVAPQVAEKAVQEAYRGVDEIQLIEAFLRRKYRNRPLNTYLAERKNLAAAYRRLRGAGFSPGNVISVLKRFAGEPELLDSVEERDEEERGS